MSIVSRSIHFQVQKPSLLLPTLNSQLHKGGHRLVNSAARRHCHWLRWHPDASHQQATGRELVRRLPHCTCLLHEAARWHVQGRVASKMPGLPSVHENSAGAELPLIKYLCRPPNSLNLWWKNPCFLGAAGAGGHPGLPQQVLSTVHATCQHGWASIGWGIPPL